MPFRPRARSSTSSKTSPALARLPRAAAIAREASRSATAAQAVTLENLYTKMAEQKVKSLNLILKDRRPGGRSRPLTEELEEELENDEDPDPGSS